MKRELRALAAAGSLSLAFFAADGAFAQKAGGILKIGHFDSPASMSMLEESTQAVNRPMSGVFNNLVIFNQDEAQNTPESIVPELATEWRWSEDGTELTFPLHQGVKWHDGKPFTAADVKCTLDLLQGKAAEKLRINPRKPWFDDVSEVSTNGDYEVTFSSETAAALFAGDAGDRVDADLSVSRVARTDASASGRHGAVQIRRIQSEPVDHGSPQSGLLETSGLTSMASNTGSSKMCRPGCSPSSRATRTSISASQCHS